MSSTSDLPRLNRRAFVAAAAGAAICTPALAQHSGHGTPPGAALPEAAPAADPFTRLQGGTPHHLTTEQIAQRKVESPAPKGPQGHWTPKAALPLPRSEMAWPPHGRDACISLAAMAKDASTAPIIMFTIRGTTDGSTPRHCRAAPTTSPSWRMGRVYALGGFIEQNRNPDPNAYAYDVAADTGTTIAPLSRSARRVAAVALEGKIHLRAPAPHQRARQRRLA